MVRGRMVLGWMEHQGGRAGEVTRLRGGLNKTRQSSWISSDVVLEREKGTRRRVADVLARDRMWSQTSLPYVIL